MTGQYFIFFAPALKPTRIKKLTGQRFGRLLVLGFAGVKGRQSMWHCLCDCGLLTLQPGVYLTQKQVASCGCWQRESARLRSFKHGESVSQDNTPEYAAYIKAKSRCNNPRDKAYAHYGGRGIEFRFESYEQFLAELGRRPSKKHSLDRIDVNGHYEPKNCRWATPKEQQRNKRSTRAITAFGKTLCISAWSEETGLTRESIRNRIDRHGWCAECALTMPPRWGRCDHRVGYETYSPEYAQKRAKWGGPVRRMRILARAKE